MKMTDSSKNNDNGNGSSNGGKRPGGPNGAGAPHSKLVKFNGNNASHSTGSNNGISNIRKSGNYTAEELLAQRKALPIYPTQEK